MVKDEWNHDPYGYILVNANFIKLGEKSPRKMKKKKKQTLKAHTVYKPIWKIFLNSRDMKLLWKIALKISNAHSKKTTSPFPNLGSFPLNPAQT